MLYQIVLMFHYYHALISIVKFFFPGLQMLHFSLIYSLIALRLAWSDLVDCPTLTASVIPRHGRLRFANKTKFKKVSHSPNIAQLRARNISREMFSARNTTVFFFVCFFKGGGSRGYSNYQIKECQIFKHRIFKFCTQHPLHCAIDHERTLRCQVWKRP
jgi:hypothetical protein